MAERSLPGSPLTRPFTSSNRAMKVPNSHQTVAPARTPPVICESQYSGRRRAGNSPGRNIAKARLTAGFRWAPERPALAYIASAMPNPQTAATCHRPTCAPVMAAAATEPVPNSTSR